MPRVRWYLPSARWYGSVFVPMAMWSPVPAGRSQLGAEPLDGVHLHDDLVVEVGADVEAEVVVGRPGEAVDAGVAAAPVRVDGVPEGHAARRRHAVDDRCGLARGRTRGRGTRPGRRGARRAPRRRTACPAGRPRRCAIATSPPTLLEHVFASTPISDRAGQDGAVHAGRSRRRARSTPVRSSWSIDRCPSPGPGELRVRVAVCGVCRTDLHLAEGDLPPQAPGRHARPRGRRRRRRARARAPPLRASATRVGIAWLRHTCGVCRFCRRGDENLCVAPRFTGWDVDGGYAEYAVVDEAFAYAIPDGVRRRARGAAPVRRHHRLPRAAAARAAAAAAGSASTASAARRTSPLRSRSPRAATVHVLTRGAEAPAAGAASSAPPAAGDADDAPPEPLDARHPVRARRRAGARRAARARPGRHAGASPAST